MNKIDVKCVALDGAIIPEYKLLALRVLMFMHI
jgi:hypothetical protein